MSSPKTQDPLPGPENLILYRVPKFSHVISLLIWGFDRIDRDGKDDWSKRVTAFPLAILLSLSNVIQELFICIANIVLAGAYEDE